MAGMTRKLDELGRVVIPIEIRRRLKLDRDSDLNISINDNDEIIIVNEKKQCFLTGEEEDLIDYKGRVISKKAIKELMRLASEECL